MLVDGVGEARATPCTEPVLVYAMKKKQKKNFLNVIIHRATDAINGR